MKILLTGQPHSGKTTLISKALSSVENKQGFTTEEILEGGRRVGFKMISADGNEAVLAHLDIDSTYKVSRYFVNVQAIEEFVKPLMEFAPDQLLYIDEIGQMELFSNNFKQLVEKYITSSNNFIGSITSVYTDDFTKKINSMTGIKKFEVTTENREEILSALSQALK